MDKPSSVHTSKSRAEKASRKPSQSLYHSVHDKLDMSNTRFKSNEQSVNEEAECLSDKELKSTEQSSDMKRELLHDQPPLLLDDQDRKHATTDKLNLLERRFEDRSDNRAYSSETSNKYSEDGSDEQPESLEKSSKISEDVTEEKIDSEKFYKCSVDGSDDQTETSEGSSKIAEDVTEDTIDSEKSYKSSEDGSYDQTESSEEFCKSSDGTEYKSDSDKSYKSSHDGSYYQSESPKKSRKRSVATSDEFDQTESEQSDRSSEDGSDSHSCSSGQYEADVSSDDSQAGDNKYYREIFQTTSLPPTPNINYLDGDERKPPIFGLVHVPAVDEEFGLISTFFTVLLEQLRLMKTRSKTIPHICLVWPATLDSVMRHLRNNHSRVTAKTGVYLETQFWYPEVYPDYFLHVENAIIFMVACINSFDSVATNHSVVAAMKRVTSMKRQEQILRKVHRAHKNDPKGLEYVEICKEGLKLLREIPGRWQKMVEEMNDVTDEFLIALQHFMTIPVQITRQKKASATFSPDDGSDDEEQELIEEAERANTESEGASEKANSEQPEREENSEEAGRGDASDNAGREEFSKVAERGTVSKDVEREKAEREQGSEEANEDVERDEAKAVSEIDKAREYAQRDES